MYDELAAGEAKAGLIALPTAAGCWFGARVEEIAKPCCRFLGSLEADAMMGRPALEVLFACQTSAFEGTSQAQSECER